VLASFGLSSCHVHSSPLLFVDARATPFRDLVLQRQHSFPVSISQSSIYTHQSSHSINSFPRFHGFSSYPSISSTDDTIFQIMHVRKLIESYEQERTSTTSQPLPCTTTFRSRPRTRPRAQPADTSLMVASQRFLRMQRPSNLKIATEERPVTIVLKVCLHLPNIWLSVDCCVI
jgi:hypothetical protein